MEGGGLHQRRRTLVIIILLLFLTPIVIIWLFSLPFILPSSSFVLKGSIFEKLEDIRKILKNSITSLWLLQKESSLPPSALKKLEAEILRKAEESRRRY
jgi:hypothetical protein